MTGKDGKELRNETTSGGDQAGGGGEVEGTGRETLQVYKFKTWEPVDGAAERYCVKTRTPV